MKTLAIRFLGTLVILNFLVCGSACVRTKIPPLPQPPTTAKLRVFVLAATSEAVFKKGPVRWQTSPEKFNANMTEWVNKGLKIQGIYEVVPSEEIKAVLGDQTIASWEWMASDWALAKDVGRALHADYALLIERSVGVVNMEFSLDLINLNTGKLFQASNYISNVLMYRLNDDEKIQACVMTIRKNFYQISGGARKDFLNTAMLKGRLLPENVPPQVSKITSPENIPQKLTRTDEANAEKEDKPQLLAKSEPPQKQKETPLLTSEAAPSVQTEPHKTTSSAEKEIQDKPKEITMPQSQADSLAKDGVKEIPAPKAATPDRSKEETSPQPKTIAPSRDAESGTVANKKAQEKQIAFEKDLEETILGKNKKQDGTRLIVYDFDAVERLRIVGMILAEALREELYKLGGFVLVNRENMVQVMEEYKLQHSSLVDEKQLIKIGQWLSANEAVTGMLAPLGATSILQAKRIDIKKMSTIALGSLKCQAGKEDELLDNMPLLARKLVQSQK